VLSRGLRSWIEVPIPGDDCAYRVEQGVNELSLRAVTRSPISAHFHGLASPMGVWLNPGERFEAFVRVTCVHL
jgi:hypothetical protein